MSAMGYGRYEKGEREPSFQSVSFIANSFGTTTDYLYGLSDRKTSDVIIVSSTEDPKLFQLIETIKENKDFAGRIFAYSETIQDKK